MSRSRVPGTILALCSMCFLARPAFAQAPAVFEVLDESALYAKAQGWMTGYPDGSFRPDKTLTRAELVKIVIVASGHDGDAGRCARTDSLVLEDVPQDAWFSPYTCSALEQGILTAPKDGFLRPAHKVTLAEAAKILSVGIDGFDAPETSPWYEPYLRHLATKNAIPATLGSQDSTVTRGEVAEILWRLKEKKVDLPSADADSLLAEECTRHQERQVQGVDLEEAKRIWLGWTNELRHEMGVRPLRSSDALAYTASLWASSAADAGSITHTRPGQTGYYDYARMTEWFASYGVTFANVNRTTFTESIGWGVFSCPKEGDCTGRFLEALRTTFDFYLSERGKTYAPHFNSLVNPEFRELGLGIAAKGNTYYLTAHYGTEITSDLSPLCP